VSKEFELSKSYDPQAIERPIYERWLGSGRFHAEPDERPPERRYVIMMPLPNITGALHMGHAMDNVMQDMLIRWHRTRGDNTLWMPGTDHAGIATQAVIEKRLKELEGLTRHDIGREGLVARIWEWKDKYQARIISQLQQMGCSCDWERMRFTMDKVCARAVRHAFFRLFEDGLIYRGKKLINWDAFLRTSISNDEVYHETVAGHFWHLRYPVIDPRPGDPEYVEVATTRPETMLGDTAVAVHPDPEGELARLLEAERAALASASPRDREAIEARIAELEERQREVLPLLLRLRDMAREGRKVMLPLVNRPIPLILDEWAKPELGTGSVKITPAHDYNDYDVWQRHKEEIEIINILNPDGTLNENAGPYCGLDRYEARERVVADLERLGLMGAIEERMIEIGHSDRSKTPIEPYLSDQWFVYMGDVPGGIEMGRGTERAFRAPGLVQAAIDVVKEGRLQFHPERFAKAYLDWLAEKRDWPISRQLWWGHRIPVWTLVTTRAEAPEALRALFEGGIEPFIRRGVACVRLSQPDEDYSRLLRSAAAPEDLVGEPGIRYMVDVCLLEDDPGALQVLERLGYVQDEDVLDTWFSSALWPHSTLGWPDPETADSEGGALLGSVDGRPNCLEYYYPGSCLVTGRDIITLWVARMVITGLYNLGEIPFHHTFIHANILDGKGERMSKSKGNGIDPVDIIEAYGADAMRYVLCDMQTGTQDIRLPVTAICPRCEAMNELTETRHGRSIFTYICRECGGEFDVLGTMEDVPSARLVSERFLEGRRFCNKLWNTARFALGNLGDLPSEAPALAELEPEDRWILARLNRAIAGVSGGLEEYNPSVAINAAREFLWGELCDWYLELIKPRLAQTGARTRGTAQRVLAHVLDQTLRLLHPFIPFVTEHLYGALHERAPERSLPDAVPGRDAELLIAASWPVPSPAFEADELCADFAAIQEITSAIRETRNSLGIPGSRALDVTVRAPAERKEAIARLGFVPRRLAGVRQFQVAEDAKRPRGAATRQVGLYQVFVHDVIDDEAERRRLTDERTKVNKEIALCDKKLGTPKFVERAPAEVVEKVRQRREKYVRQLQTIEQALADLESAEE
jgi:valyl-tRNA synthetase